MKLLTYLAQNYNYNNFRYEKPWYEQWYEIAINAPIISTIFIITVLIWIFKKRVKESHSNWNTLLDNFSYSAEDFYELLKKELSSRGIHNFHMSIKKLDQDSLGLSRRKYLKISRKDYEFYICAAPYGRGFFVSWHLIYDDSGLKVFISKIPFIGTWLVNRFFHTTFYYRDTASMFMTYTHQSVLSVINQITNEKGVRDLSEDERKPVLNDVFKR